jgi:glycine/D-amino acid oxidase-like deaminating enzyme
MTGATFDVIAVGGGVMGCAAAYYLLQADPQLKIAILERDPTYTRASTTLSDGNTRIQFNLKENVQMSLYGLEVLEHFAEAMEVDGVRPQVGFRQQGNLFLVGEAGVAEAQAGMALQQSLGGRVEWLTPAEIRMRFEIIDTRNCTGATFGPLDGIMDPYAVLMAYKRKAVSMGASFMHAEAEALQREGNRISGVRLGDGRTLAAGVVINSAGAWGSLIARTAGIELPVQPVRRQVFVLETSVRPAKLLPPFFTPSGLYCIHEGENRFMSGKSLPDDLVGFDFGWERERFYDLLWPELVEYVPAFERLKVARGWSGLYAMNTLDANAIIGEWPELEGFYLANGFSGHGFQHCHAVGRYLAELIQGRNPSLDLSIFSPERILENRPVFESRMRLI